MTTSAAETSGRLRGRLAAHLGADPVGLPVVSSSTDDWAVPRLQSGLSAVLTGCSAEYFGLLPLDRKPGSAALPASLVELTLSGSVGVATAEYHTRPVGWGRSLACLQTALVFASGPWGPLVAYIRPDPTSVLVRRTAVEVLARSPEQACAFLDDLASSCAAHDPFRGSVLDLSADEQGNLLVAFPHRPAAHRERIVLPPGALDRIERHTVEVSARSSELTARRRHLRRGVLLHGPPGVGKTMIVDYVVAAMPGSTVVRLTGRAAALVETGCRLARELAPAVVVLENVDQVARDRTLEGLSPRRYLFDLLDAMDGLHQDADILFLATTSDVAAVERAIAARPGRIDLTVRIPLPAPDCRRRLLEVHAAGTRLSVVNWQELIDRTAGAPASAFPDLVRQAVLLALEADPDADTVTVRDAHLHEALAMQGL